MQVINKNNSVFIKPFSYYVYLQPTMQSFAYQSQNRRTIIKQNL